MPIAKLVPLLQSLIQGAQSWGDAMAKYPVVRTGDEADEEEGEGGDGNGGSSSSSKPQGPTVVEKTLRGKFSRPAEAAGTGTLEGKMARMKL